MRMRTAAIAFSGFVVLGLPTGMLGIAWPSIRTALDAPLAGLGVLLAAMTVTQFGSSGLSGFVRERFGTIALLLVPTVLAAGGLALFALADTWPVLIAAAAILGAGLGLLDAAVNMEAALKRGVRFMGALHASWALGATLGPVLFGDRAGAARLFDLSVGGALVSAIAFWLLPPPVAALVALPCIGASLSVFVPLLLYLTPRRVGRAAAPRAIGYQVAAGMIGGAVLPAGIGVLMQANGVGALGLCLSGLALALGGLHIASRRGA